MSRLITGPFNRIEGEVEVQLDISHSRVEQAFVAAPMYRGFEQILHGKDPMDALVYAPRICGICSVSQSLAAANALAAIGNISPPPNGRHAQNLALATENIADHLTHFYLFFMPDFARPVYAGESWFEHAEKRFKAISGKAVAEMLPARAKFLHIMGILAGKWPHSLAIQPGGMTKSVEIQEKLRILAILSEFRQFLEETLFGDDLENIAALGSVRALEIWAAKHAPDSSDLSGFIGISNSLELQKIGKCFQDHFLSYGAYQLENKYLFTRGIFEDGKVLEFSHQHISEDGFHSWLAMNDGARHPFNGVTIPDADAEAGYSWSKAPRLNGKVVELGALARQIVDGHPLARDMAALAGGNVFSRVVARLLEIARMVPLMQQWAGELRPGEEFYNPRQMPDEGEGFGLVEAARGGLGHWVRVRNNCILNYQIIAPTTWNFSPRDAKGVPGALEQALVGAPVRDGEQDPVSVQHIIRSFDPCMVCTVH